MDEWISVKDKLPPKSDFKPPEIGEPYPIKIKILVATTKARVFETTYTALGFANLGNESVTHWMLLPKPPKE